MLTTDQTQALKRMARERIAAGQDELLTLSRRIHSNPELAWKEHRSSAWVADALEAGAFTVERGAYDLETAFVASAGSADGLTVAICAEYDALPAVGHACGHNVIAAAAVGAGLALADVAADAGLQVKVIGTPAEEFGNGSGKILLLERGAFDGVDAAMMVHPTAYDVLAPPMMAVAVFDIEYRGKESHAALYPELGINAADAMTVAQVAMGLLRQQIRSSDRIHGIVTHGGDAPNIIPARTTGRFMARAMTLDDLTDTRERLLDCFRAGALATGAELTITGGDKPYAHVEHNPVLVELYRRNAEQLGRVFETGDAATRPSASTDMGNVSLAVPTIHPFIGIGSYPAVNHQPEFTAHCITDEADRAIIDGATAMAWTAIDLAALPDPAQALSSEAPPDASA
jgi:amidohydrolase